MSRKSDIAKLERIAGLIDDTYESSGGTAQRSRLSRTKRVSTPY